MKAITIVSPSVVEIREIEKPVPGKDEALLRPLCQGSALIRLSDILRHCVISCYVSIPPP